MRVWRIVTLIGMVATCGAVRAADGPYPKGLPQAPESFPLAVWLQSPANADRYRPSEEARANARRLDDAAESASTRAFAGTLAIWILVAGAAAAGWYRVT